MVYDIVGKRKYADTYKNDQDDRSLSLKKIANYHDIGALHREKRNIYHFFYARYNVIDFRLSFNKKFVSMNVKTNDFQTPFIIKRNCRRYLTILYYTLCIRIEYN